MKRRVMVWMGMLAVLLTTTAAMAQGRGGRGPAVPACETLACDIQADWEGNKGAMVGIVNAMPDDKFGFKPTPAQESFGQRLMHVAGIDLKLVSTLGGKTPPPMVNVQATSKADVVAALRQVNDFGAAVLKEFNDQQLAERVASLPFLGPTASRLRVIYFSMTHSQDIYGQLAVYLRLSGITPPASNRP
jgi:uncharacterized damage-inducible protein DinB